MCDNIITCDMPRFKKHKLYLPLALLALALLIIVAPGAGAEQTEQPHVTDSIPDTPATDTDHILTDTGHEAQENEADVDEPSDGHSESTEDQALAGHEEGEHQGGGHELPNIMSLIFGHKANPTITDIQYWENVIYGLFGGFILIFFARRVYRRREMIPGRLQNFVEMLVENFYEFL